MIKERLIIGALIVAGIALGYFDYASEGGTGSLAQFPFKLGLDLKGGTHLVYRADTTLVSGVSIDDSLNALRDVIERRVNIFGVSEPLVQTSKTINIDGTNEGRLIVELPGVTDIDQAIALIGATPVLDFRTENPIFDRTKIVSNPDTGMLTYNGKVITVDDLYVRTELSGKDLKRATLQFNQVTGEPLVGLEFNDDGSSLFAEITKENIGKTVAIYLDGNPISAPVVESEILGGSAQINGNFSVLEAKTLVGRLNAGALPIPIALISTEAIGASLGESAIKNGVRAGIAGAFLVALFLIFWYRLPGVVATIALLMYIVIMLAIFKLIPVTLTAAGIAGFILSIGMAVDANVLIFERMKEELSKGK